MKTCLPIILLLLATFAARAEAPKAPSDPQVAAIPDYISYTKVFTYPPPVANDKLTEQERAVQSFLATPKAEKVDVIKTGNISKQTKHLSDGTDVERWKSGQLTFIIDSALKGQILVTSPKTVMHEDQVDTTDLSDFNELAWVTKTVFQGQENRQGTSCYVYRSGGNAAWIDTATRLPVYFESPSVTISYAYGPAPTTPLQLPERLVNKLKDVERAWAGRSR